MSWRCIGKIISAHSLKGEIFVFIFSGDYSCLDGADQLRLSLSEKNPDSGFAKTMKISSYRPHKNGLIMRLAELKDRTAAEQYNKYFVYLTEDQFVAPSGEVPYLSELLDFQVFDHDNLIGKVSAFRFNGAQDLLVLKVDNLEVEVPLVENFVQNIDYDNKTIHMELPEGLLDINRS